MDVNGMPIEGFYSTNLPAGLGAAPPLPAAWPVEAPDGKQGAFDKVDDIWEDDDVWEDDED